LFDVLVEGLIFEYISVGLGGILRIFIFSSRVICPDFTDKSTDIFLEVSIFLPSFNSCDEDLFQKKL
jgi:hypothetical protein